MCQSCVSIHNFFYNVPPNKRSPQPQDKVGNQVVRLGNLNVPPPVPPPGAVELGAGRGVRPPTPQPSIISQGAASCQVFLEKYFFFFFFFYYIPPFIISHFGGVCQVFFKNFFKKIFHFSIDFCFLIWYNYYRN